LVSSWNSPGGELNCEITSIRNETERVPDQNTGCDCGMEGMTRITGGQETGINQFPFMAGVIYKNDFFCGCTIIANRYLLTAGHCIYQTNPDDLLILVGDHDLSTGRDTNASKLYHVSAYEIHPWFNMTSWRNDIGIIQTSTVIKFGPAIRPVCLPFKHTYYDFAGQTGTILGWGLLKFSGVPSNTLQRADLTILSTRQCNFFDQPPTSYNELCTYEKEKDSCQHDSGGPVIWYDTSTERYVLVGIISHGKPCPSNTPGLNTRVTEYLQWIIDRTGRDTGYCVK
ncbi:venom serine protease 34-like, partial [Sitophilus oryzae]|uniref:Venom serine protease 34-like n=1 Tax=Sitophilus oryzae TaxID=7048 RepID=A0A6J2Y9X8_SITOR